MIVVWMYSEGISGVLGPRTFGPLILAGSHSAPLAGFTIESQVKLGTTREKGRLGKQFCQDSPL